jgi:hypothetical protein
MQLKWKVCPQSERYTSSPEDKASRHMEHVAFGLKSGASFSELLSAPRGGALFALGVLKEDGCWIGWKGTSGGGSGVSSPSKGSVVASTTAAILSSSRVVTTNRDGFAVLFRFVQLQNENG